MTTDAVATEVERGQAVYTPGFLKVYDLLVLRWSCRLVWRCPSSRMLAHYDEHVGTRHCDVGVGTGFFLDKASWSSDPTITLVDLNENSLEAASQRIERFGPSKVKADILQPLPDLPGAPFDSVGLNFLLHCVPGALGDKAATAFDHVAPSMAKGGVVFGTTILGDESVRRTRTARSFMAAYNRNGSFHNDRDGLDGLETALEQGFARHSVEVVGCVALFAGWTAEGEE